MRHPLKPLDRTVAMRAYRLRESLAAVDGPVHLEYTKRNGLKSSSTGTVEFFNGKDGYDNMSVTLKTADKGMRTINLAGVITAKVI